ncbi:MAG: hypothetical protein ILM98_15040 [Kiritimatiellae bacterium]|nr:hypothetical protein [Kiritimatiellia bacterium]
MPITIDLPPAIIQEAKAFAESRHTTIEKMFVDYLDEELRHNRKVRGVLSRLEELKRRTNARLSGQPYKFNRADAYEPEIPYA